MEIIIVKTNGEPQDEYKSAKAIITNVGDGKFALNIEDEQVSVPLDEKIETIIIK